MDGSFARPIFGDPCLTSKQVKLSVTSKQFGYCSCPPRPLRSFTEGSIRILRGTMGSADRIDAPVWERSGAAARGADSPRRTVSGVWFCAPSTRLRVATSSDTRKRLTRKNFSSPPRLSGLAATGLSAPCCSSSSLVGIRCLRSSRVITTSPMRTLRARSRLSCRRAVPG